jgi:hypothetical protein
MSSSHHERPCGVACFFQITEHPVRSASAQARDILSEHPTGSALTHEPEHLEPQPGSSPRETFAFPCKADVLTGEATANDIDSFTQSICSEFADVIEARDIWPVPLED